LRKFFDTRDTFGMAGVEGNIYHCVFEEILKLKPGSLTEGKKLEIVEKNIGDYVEILWFLGADYGKLFEAVKESIDEIYLWKTKFIDEDNYVYDSKEDDLRIKILSVYSTEKRFESNKFGLNGIVDVIMECSIERYSVNAIIESVQIPFELKTGLGIKGFYHGQVILYLLMLYENDLKKAEKLNGLLFYNRLDRLELVKVKGNEIFDLLMRRNQVVKKIIDMKNQIQKKQFS
jgi:hypothetical protein